MHFATTNDVDAEIGGTYMGAVTMADLHDAGLPTNRVEYWGAVERRGPLVGLMNLTMSAMEQRYLNSKDADGTLKQKLASVDAQFFSSMVSELDYNQLLMQKVLISTKSPSTLHWIFETCGDTETALLSKAGKTWHTVNMATVRDLAAKCVSNQRVLIQALQRYVKGAQAVRASTRKGSWNILHEAAALGQPTIMKYALVVEKAGVNPGPGGISPLHVAVTYGWPQLVAMLVAKGSDPHLSNPEGWSPLQMACRQMWPKELVADAFGADLAEACDCKLSTVDCAVDNALKQPPKAVDYAGPGGGWGTERDHDRAPEQFGGTAGSIHEIETSMCEVDVIESITAADFLKSYVAARRPVLMRGLLKGTAWDGLRKKWSRAAIPLQHADVKFNTSTIPYARQFDEMATEVEMDIREYIAYMDNAVHSHNTAKVHPQTTENEQAARSRLPHYIFTSLSSHLSSDSSL